MRNSKLETRLARLEAATPARPVRFVPVLKDGVDPLPDYLAKHPEAVAWDLIVIDTGIRRGED